MKWTDDEDQRLITLWEQRTPIPDLARQLGRTPHAIKTRAARLDLGFHSDYRAGLAAHHTRADDDDEDC